MKINNKIKLVGAEKEYSTSEFINSDEKLSYMITQEEGSHPPVFYDRKDMWRYFHLIPLKDPANYCNAWRRDD